MNKKKQDDDICEMALKCLYAAIDEFYINDSHLVKIEFGEVSQELYDEHVNGNAIGEKYVGERAAEFRIAHYL